MRIEEELGATARYAGEVFGRRDDVPAGSRTRSRAGRSPASAGSPPAARCACARAGPRRLRRRQRHRGVGLAVDGGIAVGGREYPLDPRRRVLVLGSGKATLAIAAALERGLGDRLDGGAVVVRRGEDTIAARAGRGAGRGPSTAQRTLGRRRAEAARARRRGFDRRPGPRLVHRRQLRADEPAAGGRHAGREAPPARAAARLGRADRRGKRGSQARFGVKGGRLAARIAPARLVNLTVSDVAGDLLDAITDPTVARTPRRSPTRSGSCTPAASGRSCQRASAATSTRRGRSLARAGRDPTPCCWSPARAPARRWRPGPERGRRPRVVSTELEGEASESAASSPSSPLSSAAASGTAPRPACWSAAAARHRPARARRRLRRRGANQEAAVAAALALAEGAPICRLLHRHGRLRRRHRRGGGIVDGQSSRARATPASISPRRSRPTGPATRSPASATRSSPGPTQTNVNDLFVLAIGDPAGGR